MNRPTRAALRARPSRFVQICGFAGLSALCLLPSYAHAQRRGQGPNPFLPPAATIHMPRVRQYHVRHLKLNFNINAADHSATGVVTHYLTPLTDPLSAFTMDARPNLKIASCKINGMDAQFEHKGDTLTIYSQSAPLQPGKEAAVEITYSMPAPSGPRQFAGANGAGGFKWIDPDPNNPDRKAGFWTQGETNTNSQWVPCYDFPNDKCTSETHTTVPEDWTVIGNGTESPSTHDEIAHTRTYNWKMDQPHSTYLLSLAGGELDVQKDMWRGVPLYYAVPKGEGRYIAGSFGNTPDMLSWFSDNLGVKYPWPKYAQTLAFDFPGGMENVSATTLGVFLADSRSGHFANSSINSHELAHQWFGDLVTCKDWGDIWLNESFATFFEMYYLEHLDGEDAYQREVENNTRSYLNSASRFQRALSTNLYAGPDDMFEQGHTYAKGGVILHMLRRQLGDKAFFKGLGYYLKKYQYTPVETKDLESALTEYTHQDVKPFFDQWIRKPGHPVLDLTWTYDDARKEVVAVVKQTQDTSDGTPIYNTPLTFGLLPDAGNANGNRKVAAQRQTVTLDQATQEFRIPAGVKPAVVLLDPDHDLLKGVKDNHWTDAMLPIILRSAPSAIDRQRAASLLKGDVDPKAETQAPNFDFSQFDTPGYMESYRRRQEAARLAADGVPNKAIIGVFAGALPSESSEETAAYLLRRLSAAKDESLRPLFRAQARAKQSARRAAALDALGQLTPTDEDTRTLRAAALSDTEQYTVVRAALNALARQNAQANLDVFQHQIGQTSLNDTLASTSVEALALVKSEAVVPLLLAATTPSHANGVRLQAVRAISTQMPGSPAVHQAFVALLNDPSPRLEQAAIKALSTRMDKEAIPALKTLASTSKVTGVQKAANDAVAQLEGGGTSSL